MRFDQEFEIPLSRPDGRILVRTGGRPIKEYAVMLQVQFGERWRTIRLIDNHLDQHHVHRYDGLVKRQLESTSRLARYELCFRKQSAT
jgi:hypothetical protein